MPGTTKSGPHARRNRSRNKFRVLDTVRTTRGEGIIKFVFTRIRDGKTSYAVNFSDKRMGVIFHETELVHCSGKTRQV